MAENEECAFCRDRATTGEHAWPDWYCKLIGQEHKYLIKRNIKGVPRQFVNVGVHLKLYTLCDDCNNGWGSRLEEKMKPVLGKMYKGEPKKLTSTDIATIASWCLLKAFVCDYARDDGKPSFHDRSERFSFRRDFTFPIGLQMWLARSTEFPGAFAGGYAEAPLNLPNRREFFVFTVSLGEFLIQMTCARWMKKSRRRHANPPILVAPLAWSRFATPIWPRCSFPVNWPPPSQLAGKTLQEFIDRWKFVSPV
jgi:hypothetical protein